MTLWLCARRKLEVDKQRLADKHVEFEQLLASSLKWLKCCCAAFLDSWHAHFLCFVHAGVQQRIDMPDEELDRHIEQCVPVWLCVVTQHQLDAAACVWHNADTATRLRMLSVRSSRESARSRL